MASLQINVLERSRVSPPPYSVTQTSLPLTFFDIFWLPMTPVKRLFFYELTHPKTDFIDVILPRLKLSLSLTLQFFYPLAGNLNYSNELGKPVISYMDGDSVELTVAESDAEFYQLAQNNPRDVTKHHPLVPNLPPVSGTSATPVLALQLTVFPDSGFCIGITTHHAAADGRSSTNFLKSWASVCRLGGTSSLAPLPLYDRSLIKDPNGLEAIFFNQLAKLKEEVGSIEVPPKSRVDLVLATFVLKRADVEKLRQSLSAQRGDNMGCSTFVLTCAYVWVCLAKARQDIGDDTEHFGFVVDCRARLDPPVPDTYFGNCIGACFVETKGSDLVGEDGMMIASEAIGNAIRGLRNGVLRGAEAWLPKFFSLPLERVVSVAGSPIFRVYDTDFGWGRPCKVEVVSIEGTNAMSLAENRNEEGGVEIGLTRPKHIMDCFASLFQEGLHGEK